jgi:quercetin dioxygenase-like cupin family protein
MLTLDDFERVILSNSPVRSKEAVVELRSIEGSKVVVAVFHFKPGDVRDWHTHPDVRLTFVRAGKMRLTFEDAVIELAAGDFISTLANKSHKLEVLGDDNLYLIEIIVPVN